MKLHAGSGAANLDEDEVSLADSFIISVVQIYEQLYHETREGILGGESLDEFTGQSVFSLPYFKEKWPFYRVIFSKQIVVHIEEKYGPFGGGGPAA